jgi:dehydrogenase/reductase SDR family protein 12
VFGVYYLTQKLIPCLHEKSRVIIVSSGGMYSTPLVNDDIYMKKDFDGTTQYARNKRMQVILAE